MSACIVASINRLQMILGTHSKYTLASLKGATNVRDMLLEKMASAMLVLPPSFEATIDPILVLVLACISVHVLARVRNISGFGHTTRTLLSYAS